LGNTEHQFRPIASGRSFELVIREMQKAIVRGDLKPGEKLPAEPDLAAQFGVSRSALREALKVLELSGYLDVRRGYGGGTFVATPEAEEFTTISAPPVPTLDVSAAQLFEVRLAIEPYAARLAASAPFDHVLGLHEAVRHMEVFDDRPARVLQAAVDFHFALAKASRNPIFVALLQDLRPAMYRAMNRFVQDPRWREACRNEHERIVKEIEAGEPARAERAMRKHLTSKGESLG
jgi:GntR family transcriptional regulator, transcriptional repressor for pyruvate dehydrogenase complex